MNWPGISRGISLVPTGYSIGLLWNPKNAPTKERGTDIPNQRAKSATNVKKGIAAEDPSYHKTRFITKKWAKTILYDGKET